MRPPTWSWLGRVPYGEALRRQRARRAAVLAGEAAEAVWLLEHPSTITTGRRAAPGTASPAELAAAGVDYHRTERGGLATWHGPGQLVAYLLVDIDRRGGGVRRLVGRLEDAVIGWLAARGIAAGRRGGLPGVWVRGDKICALGLHVHRGVTMHGIALNLDPDLSGYGLIVPCGVTDGGVTSVAEIIGAAPTPAEAAPSLAAALQGAVTRPGRASFGKSP